MRKIQTRDIFSAARILTESGIKEKLTDIIGALNGKENVERIGIIGMLETIGVFSEPTFENAFYRWLAPIAGMEPEEIETAGIDTMTAVLQSLSAENDLQSFVGALLCLLRKK